MKVIKLRALLGAVALLTIPQLGWASNVMLTGEIAAKNSEEFFAPRVSGWQIQIEWMLPEGQIAKPGDLVVLFDRATVDSDIEMKEADLLKKKEQLKLTRANGKETVMEAEFSYQKALLEHQKSEVQASIGQQYVSAYEFEKANVEMQKKLLAVEKSKRQLQAKKEETKTELDKKLTDITKAENELFYVRKKSELTAIHTKFGGPILYASHPWNGSKITAGSSAQATWKVAEIASSDEMQVKAWLNEVDKGDIESGKKVKVSIDALPDVHFQGVIKHVVPQAEEREAWGNAAYFEVHIDIENYKDAGLVPGMSVLVEVM